MLRGVMPSEAFDQPPGFGRWKRLVERPFGMDVEVVLDQDNGLACAKRMSAKYFKT